MVGALEAAYRLIVRGNHQAREHHFSAVLWLNPGHGGGGHVTGLAKRLFVGAERAGRLLGDKLAPAFSLAHWRLVLP